MTTTEIIVAIALGVGVGHTFHNLYYEIKDGGHWFEIIWTAVRFLIFLLAAILNALK